MGSGRVSRAVWDQGPVQAQGEHQCSPGLQVAEPGQCQHPAWGLPQTPSVAQGTTQTAPACSHPALGHSAPLTPPRQRFGPFLRTPQTCPHPSWHRRQRPAAAGLSCLQTWRSTDGRVAPAGGWAKRSGHDLVRPWAVGCTRAVEAAGRPGGAFGIGQAGTPHPCPGSDGSRAVPSAGEVPGVVRVVSSSSNETNHQQLKTKRKRSPSGVSRAGRGYVPPGVGGKERKSQNHGNIQMREKRKLKKRKKKKKKRKTPKNPPCPAWVSGAGL